jgi:hypothetical protein
VRVVLFVCRRRERVQRSGARDSSIGVAVGDGVVVATIIADCLFPSEIGPDGKKPSLVVQRSLPTHHFLAVAAYARSDGLQMESGGFRRVFGGRPWGIPAGSASQLQGAGGRGITVWMRRVRLCRGR